jgi:hypothetical protein
VANALLWGGVHSVPSVSVHMNGRVMIKIRYVDPNKISPGLHAAVECHGRNTTVYLLCGLRPQQRRAAFRRVRMSARMGNCPALPAPQLVLARLADRIRTSLGQAGAVFRSHPAGSTVPLMVVSAGAIAFLLLSTVSIPDLHGPRPPGQLTGAAPAPVAPASVAPVPGPLLEPLPGGLIPAAHAGPASELQTPASRGSAGVAAFTSLDVSSTATSRPTAARPAPADSNAAPVP